MKQPKYVGESMKASAAARSKPETGSAHKFSKFTAGAGSGPGRLQKTKNAKAK